MDDPASENRWQVETGAEGRANTGPGAAAPNRRCSRDGRAIPLQVKALLEAGERPWVTRGGIRVVPRKFTPLTIYSRGRFLFPRMSQRRTRYELETRISQVHSLPAPAH